MGASDFSEEVTGKTAEEAFESAKENARYEYGHNGYTGTIAEKGWFQVIEVPEGIKPYEYIDMVFEEHESVPKKLHEMIADKYADAACIQVAPDRWIFFGMAAC